MLKKKKIHSENNRLFSIIEELKDGFCIIKSDGEFVYTNIAALELFGIKSIESSVNFFTHIIKKESDIQFIQDTLNLKGFIKDYEIEFLNFHEINCPVLLTINQIKDLSNHLIGFSILLKDMTYIKRVQQQLLQAQKMESIGLLASGIAHEFNNILTGILPNAELIKLSTPNSDSNNKRADLIQKSAHRAADIVKKLLNFAREDQFGSSQASDFTKIAMESFDIIRKLFDKNIHILIDLEKDLEFVKIDATQLQQIIMNLALNAKDAITKEGKIIFRARNFVITDQNKGDYKQLTRGKYVRLEIEDTGHGISKDNLKHIFDPFFTTKRPGKGTGLGLSMVYGIIKNINGEIEVHSDLDKGTVFTIFIPKATSIKSEPLVEQYLKKIGKNRSILVIDDENMILELAHDMLRSIGFKVYTANRAEEGVKFYRENQSKIDIVFLDLIMPDMDGITCYHKLKEINPTVNIIIVSGIGDEEKKKELMDMGMVHYMEKPFSIHNLISKLETVL